MSYLWGLSTQEPWFVVCDLCGLRSTVKVRSRDYARTTCGYMWNKTYNMSLCARCNPNVDQTYYGYNGAFVPIQGDEALPVDIAVRKGLIKGKGNNADGKGHGKGKGNNADGCTGKGNNKGKDNNADGWPGWTANNNKGKGKGKGKNGGANADNGLGGGKNGSGADGEGNGFNGDANAGSLGGDGSNAGADNGDAGLRWAGRLLTNADNGGGGSGARGEGDGSNAGANAGNGGGDSGAHGEGDGSNAGANADNGGGGSGAHGEGNDAEANADNGLALGTQSELEQTLLGSQLILMQLGKIQEDMHLMQGDMHTMCVTMTRMEAKTMAQTEAQEKSISSIGDMLHNVMSRIENLEMTEPEAVALGPMADQSPNAQIEITNG